MFSLAAPLYKVDNEELVFTLETVVEKFGDEIAPFALGTTEKLAAAFWKYSSTAEEDDEDDVGKRRGGGGHLWVVGGWWGRGCAEGHKGSVRC